MNSTLDFADYILRTARSKYIAAAIGAGRYKNYMPSVQIDWCAAQDIDKPIRLTDRAAIVEGEHGNRLPVLLVDLTEPDDEPGTKFLASAVFKELMDLGRDKAVHAFHFYMGKVPENESKVPFEKVYEKITAPESKRSPEWAFNSSNLIAPCTFAQTAKNHRFLKKIGYVKEAVEAATEEIKKTANPDWNRDRCLSLIKLLEWWKNDGVELSPMFVFPASGTASAVASAIAVANGKLSMFDRMQEKAEGAQQVKRILDKLGDGLSIEAFRPAPLDDIGVAFLVFSDGEEIKTEIDSLLWATKALSCIEINEALYEMVKQIGVDQLGGSFAPHISQDIASVLIPNTAGAKVYAGKTLSSTLTAFKKLMNKNKLVPPDEVVGVVDFYGHTLRWGIEGLQHEGFKNMKISVWLLNGVAASGDFLHKVAGGDTKKKEELELTIAERTAIKFSPSSAIENLALNFHPYAQLHWEDLNRFANTPERKKELQKALVASVINELNAALKPPVVQQEPAAQKPREAPVAKVKREGSPLTLVSYNRLIPALLKCASSADIGHIVEETISCRVESCDVALVVNVKCNISKYKFNNNMHKNIDAYVAVETPEILEKIREATEAIAKRGEIENSYLLKGRIKKICSVQTSLKTMADCYPNSPEDILMKNFTEEDILDLTKQLREAIEELKDNLAGLNEETLEELKDAHPAEAMEYYLQQTASNGMRV